MPLSSREFQQYAANKPKDVSPFFMQHRCFYFNIFILCFLCVHCKPIISLISSLKRSRKCMSKHVCLNDMEQNNIDKRET